jgi:hypothetical protein
MKRKFQEPLGPASKFRPQQEISRILTAAVINTRFRQMLLSNPAGAIAMGFGGEAFHLGNETRQYLASIQATSLADFASQLVRNPDISKTTASFSAGD